MTRDEYRAKCIEAMEAAFTHAVPYRDFPFAYRRKGLIAAFNALHGIAPVCPVEATEEMIDASNKEWDGRMSVRSSGVWRVMSAAGDLTNPPEEKL